MKTEESLLTSALSKSVLAAIYPTTRLVVKSGEKESTDKNLYWIQSNTGDGLDTTACPFTLCPAYKQEGDKGVAISLSHDDLESALRLGPEVYPNKWLIAGTGQVMELFSELRPWRKKGGE